MSAAVYPKVTLPSHVQTILITGAGGFVGQQLLISLSESFPNINFIITDVRAPSIPASIDQFKQRIASLGADLSNKDEVKNLFEGRQIDAIYAVHGIMSGGSEANFDLGYQVNVDSHTALLAATRAHHIQARQGSPLPLYVYVSGLAVYGGEKCIPEAEIEPETTPLFPETSYGTAKAICELYVFDYTRKGFIDGRIIRLPTVAIRSGAPSSAASSFISGLIREPLQGQRSECPVADSIDDPNLDNFPLYLSRVSTVIHNFIHVLSLPASAFPSYSRTVNFPGITVTTRDIIEALAVVGGSEALNLIDFKKDPKVLSIMAFWPGSFNQQAALSLGFIRDDPKTGFLDAVRDFQAELKRGQ
ncbi:Putative NAD-dependent epimerases [Phaffia rhodozyma]|uniref:Putative NAD-dependent epimerases n=1 Tax=Phaffia rhodozyma TaxID=264483 RepID=A0A0F7SY45_PHARH|nr:Putative NAD-dependent epimerases [Phaffia rhodozyma]